MTETTYFVPESISEAISLLSSHKEGAKILAGGTALMVLLKQKLLSPQCLINIKKIQDLRYIVFDGEKGVRIGALTCLTDMEFDPIMGRHFPLLIDGLKSVGSRLIRNTATVGGNLCHGDPASGLISPLMSLDCKLRLVGSNGERWVPIDGFYVDFYETKILPDEILTELYIPFPPPHSGSAYSKYCVRKAMDRPIVNVAAAITLDPRDHTCREIRIVVGAIENKAIRAKRAEELLLSRRVDLPLIEKAADGASEEVSPIADIYNSEAYKREMVKVFVRRTIKLAYERARSI